MYIDALTLFIIGEIVVVYIIITIFLFYKGRLYNVLVDLLKEMRFEKLRREQLKQKELNALRKSNSDLIEKNKIAEQTAKSAGKSTQQQLAERIDHLVSEHPRAKDLDASVEHDDSLQWLRVRLLELEKERLSGNIDESMWQELAAEAVTRFHHATADEQDRRTLKRDAGEQDRYTHQLESDLADAHRILDEAKVKIASLESELDDIKSITTPSENPLKPPKPGRHDDEIYRLKCDNFDLQEDINKLKLVLQQGQSIEEQEYIDLLEKQLSHMEQYIKSADIASGLYEKELHALQTELTQLQAKELTMQSLASELKQSEQHIDHLEGKLANQRAKALAAKLEDLSGVSEGQKNGLNALKTLIDQAKSDGATEENLSEQANEIARLERFLTESDTLIQQLEHEIDVLSEALANQPTPSVGPDSNEDIQEMEELLQQFISDTQSLLKEINALEDQNKQLREQQQAADTTATSDSDSDALP